MELFDGGSWNLFQPQAPAAEEVPKEEAKPKEKLNFIFDPGVWIFWAVAFIVVWWIIFI